MLLLRDESLRIRDLGSRNGTFVNHRRLGTDEKTLSTGDIVSIGEMVCQIDITLATQSAIRRRLRVAARKHAPDPHEGQLIDQRRGAPAKAPQCSWESGSVATGPASWKNALSRPAANNPAVHHSVIFSVRVEQRRATAAPRVLPRIPPKVAPRVELPNSRLPRPSIDPQRSLSWRASLSDSVALKPISVNESRLARRADEDEDYEPGPYQLAETHAQARKKPSTRPAGFIKSFYRGAFGKLAGTLRWINETAYGISILFLMLACVGFAMWVYENADSTPSEPPQQSNPVRGLGQIEAELAQADLPAQGRPLPNYQAEVPQSAPNRQRHPIKQNSLTIAGITGIVVLNFLRLVVGVANLVVIPFRKSPMQGVLFLIPPLTLVYIWRHWTKVRKPVGRVIGPLVALVLVVAAYTFVPGLSAAGRSEGNLRSRLGHSVNVLHRDVTRQLDKTGSDVKSLKQSLEKDLPRNLENAQKVAREAKRRINKAVEDFTTSPQDEKSKAPAAIPDSAKDKH
jgi:hypothetical protein